MGNESFSELFSTIIMTTGRKIAMVAGVLIGIGSGFLFVFYYKKKKWARMQEDLESLKVRYAEQYDLAEKLTSDIKKEQILPLKTLDCVYELGVLLSERKFADLILENRQARRRFLPDDLESYSRSVIEFKNELESIYRNNIRAVLDSLKLPKALFSSSTEYWTTHQDPPPLISFSVFQKIKSSLGTSGNRTVSKETATEILAFMQDMYVNLSKNSKYSGWKMLVKMCFVADMVFDEYGIEEEDLKEILLKDQDLLELVEALLTSIGKQGLIESVDLAYYNSQLEYYY